MAGARQARRIARRASWASAVAVAAAAVATATGCGIFFESELEPRPGQAELLDLVTQAAQIGAAPSVDGLQRVFCDPARGCPEIRIEGRSDAAPCLDGVFDACPVGGLSGASLRLDPETGALWMAYVEESLAFVGAPAADRVRRVASVGLAWSEDGGRSWRDGGYLEAGAPIEHPARGFGPQSARAPSLEKLPDGGWAALWRRDFARSKEVAIQARVGRTPGHLVAASTASVYSGWAAPSAWRAKHILAARDPLLADCAVIGEAAMLALEDRVYMVVECIDFRAEDNRRRAQGGGLHLFEFAGSKPQEGAFYIGPLLTYSEARALTGGAPLAAAAHPALALSRDGRPLLLTSLYDADPTGPLGGLDRGCHVFEITDLSRAELARAPDGAPQPKAILRLAAPDVGAALGEEGVGRLAYTPGECAYDPASDTGVVMTVVKEDLSVSPPRMRASLHATGLHP